MTEPTPGTMVAQRFFGLDDEFTRGSVVSWQDISSARAVAAAGRQPTAVMIARGDLAVEISPQHMSEVQEQLLWLCEAAHIPVVWATQVIDNLLKTGIPSRAEATDAAMAQRAECVMLNKGDHVVEAVRFLDNFLHRMVRHVSKKSALLGPLSQWAAIGRNGEAKKGKRRRGRVGTL